MYLNHLNPPWSGQGYTDSIRGLVNLGLLNSSPDPVLHEKGWWIPLNIPHNNNVSTCRP